MYKQFCKNLHYYISINTKSQSRLDIAKDILLLADIVSYQKHKEKRDIVYQNVGAFITALKSYQEKYPYIRKFIWELWAYGFDLIEINTEDAYKISFMDEKAQLIDLLLHTHYFA